MLKLAGHVENFKPHVAHTRASLGLPKGVFKGLAYVGAEWGGDATLRQGAMAEPEPDELRLVTLCFPAFDGHGRMTGIQRRFANPAPGESNKKWVKDSKPGLFVAAEWDTRPGPLLIPEGVTDTLALYCAGLATVGRPSNTDGVGHLTTLLKTVPADRPVIVVGENDRKDDGTHPGKEAEGVARKLAHALKRPVLVAYPPAGAKDVREWLVARGDAEWPARGRELLAHLTAAAATPPVATAIAVDGRPSVLIGVDEYRVNHDAANALASDPNLYQRAGSLVEVARTGDDQAEADRPVRRQPGSYVIRVLPRSLVRERMTRTVRFEREFGEGEQAVVKPSHPPDWCINAVYDRSEWPGVKRLEAVVTHPVFLADGRVLGSPGYDAASGLMISPPPGLTVEVPDSPRQQDAAAAVALLRDVVRYFPFAEPHHFSGWVAGLLTPLAWFAFNGNAPLFLIDANIRSAGKGLLADCIGIPLTGQRFPVMTYTHEEDELRRRITSLAAEGERTVLFDNLTGKIGNGPFAAALTTDVWKDRILGVGRTFTGPLHLTWYATGNNVSLVGDLARRCCHIRLNSPHERPELRDDIDRPDQREWVRQRRGAILSAALTILRYYHYAGRPVLVSPPWASFEGWSNLVRQAVVHAGLADPFGSQDGLIEESDEDARLLRCLITGIEWMDITGRGVTAADIAKRAAQEHEPSDGQDALTDAVTSICTGNPTTWSRQLAAKLKEYQQRVCDDKRIVKGPLKSGIQLWQVSKPPASGSSGSSGSVLVHGGNGTPPGWPLEDVEDV